MLKRELYLSKIRGFYDSDLIKILVGIRRCGKSVILTQIIEELKEKAANHTKMMEAGFKEEIDECVKGTKIYGGDGAAVAEVSERMPDIELTDTVPDTPARSWRLPPLW